MRVKQRVPHQRHLFFEKKKQKLALRQHSGVSCHYVRRRTFTLDKPAMPPAWPATTFCRRKDGILLITASTEITYHVALCFLLTYSSSTHVVKRSVPTVRSLPAASPNVRPEVAYQCRNCQNRSGLARQLVRAHVGYPPQHHNVQQPPRTVTYNDQGGDWPAFDVCRRHAPRRHSLESSLFYRAITKKEETHGFNRALLTEIEEPPMTASFTAVVRRLLHFFEKNAR